MVGLALVFTQAVTPNSSVTRAFDIGRIVFWIAVAGVVLFALRDYIPDWAPDWLKPRAKRERPDPTDPSK